MSFAIGSAAFSSVAFRAFSPANKTSPRNDTPLAQQKIKSDSLGHICKKDSPKFDDKSLYKGDSPKPSDIRQDSIGDCYYVSAIGSLAQQNPKAIQDAISYDPSTDSFNVTMYRKEPQALPFPHMATKAVTINVTQEELAYNLTRKGGSTVDNNPCKDGASWPMVMETAYAKMHDSDPADGLKEGFDKIGRGGWPGDAMFAVTGKDSRTVSFDEGLTSFLPTYDLKKNAIYNQVDDALESGKPVTLSVKDESLIARISGKQDNLVDNHAYMVTDIRRDENGEVWVKLRNPWGHNNDGEGTDSSNAEVEVKLSDLHASGTMTGIGAWGFEIGG